jgi:hypothetical protein
VSAELTERQRETADDIRLYVEIGLAPVRCRSCGVQALVKKNSIQHTSIQWSSEAVSDCPVMAAGRAAGPDRLVLGCPQLRASIDAAVAAGELVVPDA